VGRLTTPAYYFNAPILPACATDTRIALNVPAATSLSQAPVGAQKVSITLLRAQDLRADRTSLGGIHQVFERNLRSNTDAATWVEDSRRPTTTAEQGTNDVLALTGARLLLG
jgi:hypothetical protein